MNYFIDNNFQTKFIIRFCLLIAFSGLLSGILIYWANTQTTTVAFENTRVVVKSTSDFILPITLQVLTIVVFIVSIATVFVTLFASHKIAGPLYRLKQELSRVKNGNFAGAIVPRSDDQLKVIVDELESLRVELNHSFGVVKGAWIPIKRKIQEVSDADIEENRRKELNSSIQTIEEILTKYQTN